MLHAWSDTDEATHSLFFEDDISVSPLYFSYAFQCAQLFLINDTEGRNSQVLGCSLYTPRLDEISPTTDTQHPPLWNPSLAIGESKEWIFYQLPCSWGAVYERQKWIEFTRYFAYRLAHLDSVPPVPNSRSNSWAQSWKRYYFNSVLRNAI